MWDVHRLQELAQEHAQASSAEEALAVSEQHLQQQLDKAQIELRAESARAEEELKAVQGERRYSSRGTSSAGSITKP